ncbi:MAG: gliding motility-associated-like protein [Halioglobus sp.]|jgi:gliding motility-associated-like protein
MMKKKYLKYSVFLFVLAFFMMPLQSYAKHIVGGDVTYKFMSRQGGNVTFEVTFTMYRDSQGGGAQFDNQGRFGLFRGNGNSWSHVRTYIENPADIQTIDIDTGNPCLEVPSGIGVQSGVYKFSVTFEVSTTESYMIAYQRCCRNNSIFNILSPEDTGAVFSTTISPFAQAEGDNSPTFNDFPPVVICANSLLNFDHSATDVDGDQIVYSFCTPLSAGGTDGVSVGMADDCTGITPNPMNCLPPFDEVNFRLPQYRFDDPLGNGVNVAQNTGLISGVPMVLGQFVVGVCATTFRNGVEIGRLSRDFQFNVTNCEISVQASIGANDIVDGEQFIVNSCGDFDVDFVNLSSDVTKIFSYDWQFDILGDLVEFDTKDISYTFPDTGRYEGVLLLNNSGDFDNCKDTAYLIVNIFPEIIADFEFMYDTCIAGPVDFTNLSTTGAGNILINEWTFEQNEKSDFINPTYMYSAPGVKPIKLAVEDKNECRDSLVQDLTWYPVPSLIIVEPNMFIGCVPSSISFNNLSAPIDSTYDVIWDFGDGTTVNEISPTHIYEEVGNYSISVDITSPLDCQTDTSFGDWIRVLESPEAGFSFTPEMPSIFNRTVDFIDESSGAVSWFYNIDGLGFLERNPTYTFSDTGIVEVVQVVTHPSGCTDSLAILLDIKPLVTLHMPNAFTPNNDGLNDFFKGKGFFDGFQDYRMNVWNRWGEKVYETLDPNVGWNGKKDNSGENSPVGVYVYTIQYTGPRGEANELKGHVTLIR